MHHVVAPVDCISDHTLDSLGLDPRLAIDAIDVAVSPEERIVHTSLVHTHPHLLRWRANEAWEVSAAKDGTTNSVLHNHFYRAEYLFIYSKVITCPISTIFLRSKEVRAGQDKWSESSLITINKSLVAHLLLGGAISVMEFTMFNFLTIGADMLSSSRDCLALL